MRATITTTLTLSLLLAVASCSDDTGQQPGLDAGVDMHTAEAGADGAPQPDQGAAAGAHHKEVNKLVKPIMDGKWTVGLVVGLLSANGQEIYSFGKATKGGAAPDGDTLFEIGSVTKTFTSLALADMAQKGEVTLTQKVNTLLPAAKVKVPGYSGQEISLTHLSTHTSGLPRMPTNIKLANNQNPFAGYYTADLYSFLNAYTLPRAPGASWEYSNLATGLLGHALALKANKTYEGLIKDRITVPLKLKDTVIKLSAAQKSRAAQGYDWDLKSTPAWDFDVLAPCGALRSSAKDMLAYLSAQAGLTSTTLDKAMAESHKSHYAGGTLEMGLGWIHQGKEKRWHNGGTYGFETFAGFDKKKKVGVIVLSNGFTLWGPQTKLGMALLKMMAGESYKAPDIPPTLTLPTATLDKYTGTYTASAATAVIQRNGPDMSFSMQGQGVYGMYARATDKFYLRASQAGITFIKDAAGKYSSFELSTASGKTTFTR